MLRVYFDPAEIGTDGYPFAWHQETLAPIQDGLPNDGPLLCMAIKDFVRDQADYRCVRCGHPYRKGDGEWSRCDECCSHPGPVRDTPNDDRVGTWRVEAQWRILTVHHLNRVKHDCRWWNLAALCQRCHLTIQGKVYLERRWRQEHSEWFKPYAAGWYAWSFLGEELTREETTARLEELLALEDRQLDLMSPDIGMVS